MNLNLERQIVLGSRSQVVDTGSGCHGLGGGCCSSGSRGSCWCCAGGCVNNLLGLPAANVGVVAALILTALDVEIEVYHVAHVEVELVGTVAKEVEINLARNALKGLEQVVLLFPWITSLRGTALKVKLLYNLAFYFHID